MAENARVIVDRPSVKGERVQRRGGVVAFIRAALGMFRDDSFKISTRFKLMAVLGVLYLLSPVDLIPEIIFGPLGIVDDLGAVLLVFRLFADEVSRYMKERRVRPTASEGRWPGKKSPRGS